MFELFIQFHFNCKHTILIYVIVLFILSQAYKLRHS